MRTQDGGSRQQHRKRTSKIPTTLRAASRLRALPGRCQGNMFEVFCLNKCIYSFIIVELHAYRCGSDVEATSFLRMKTEFIPNLCRHNCHSLSTLLCGARCRVSHATHAYRTIDSSSALVSRSSSGKPALNSASMLLVAPPSTFLFSSDELSVASLIWGGRNRRQTTWEGTYVARNLVPEEGWTAQDEQQFSW